ncbi:putative hemerythrin-like protein [Talaromyces atroroseus]|uniref:Putative hemerythrin-like protein n=1 Tax=Talaromyces atroroseus TaxID=1441469 RepID=A0A225ARM1_TALAT|nr:putative hemerythrin-like protein [Talaromyces atroroseus]OKL58229.1 putative hemerythrin-like protein [Talaromyces atroroseus]
MSFSRAAHRVLQASYPTTIACRGVSKRWYSATAPVMSLISETIQHDHRELEDAYKKILSNPDLNEKKKWQNQFTWELARHSIAEELLVYPAMERHLSDGKRLADKDRAEHQSVKEQLYKFQSLQPADPDFEPTLQGLWADLGQHIKEEEEHDMVELEKALQESESQALVTKFNRTKKFIPSRSHPSAPNKPPFETVAGLMAAPIDHLSDIFRSFPDESKSELPP